MNLKKAKYKKRFMDKIYSARETTLRNLLAKGHTTSKKFLFFENIRHGNMETLKELRKMNLG